MKFRKILTRETDLSQVSGHCTDDWGDCYGGATDICPGVDRAVCHAGAYDECTTQDYFQCGFNATDICESDYAGCAYDATDTCYLDQASSCQGAGVIDS